MASRQGVFSSSVGTKILIGITGILLFIYLLIHIAGNLVVFLGPAAFYRGRITQDIVATVAARGGVLTPEDFSEHRGEVVRYGVACTP